MKEIKGQFNLPRLQSLWLGGNRLPDLAAITTACELVADHIVYGSFRLSHSCVLYFARFSIFSYACIDLSSVCSISTRKCFFGFFFQSRDLRLVGNPFTTALIESGDSYLLHVAYRYQMIQYFPKLVSLDTVVISQVERHEAGMTLSIYPPVIVYLKLLYI